jgi:hypothetical protein
LLGWPHKAHTCIAGSAMPTYRVIRCPPAPPPAQPPATHVRHPRPPAPPRRSLTSMEPLHSLLFRWPGTPLITIFLWMRARFLRIQTRRGRRWEPQNSQRTPK